LTGGKNGGICLITGFGSFGKHKTNPSQLIALAFPDNFQSEKGTSLDIESVVLETIGATVWKNLKKAVKKKEPSIIIMLGLASGRKAISLERFAMNLRDYSIADEEGQKVKDKPIDKEGPTSSAIP
jgi:Pyrrolidone-carboxylate peptidase (N-terminal pyroglutamyl peptidase)